MLIKVWASVDSSFPNHGPYNLLDTVEVGALCSVGEMTHYGEVIFIPPPLPPFTDGADQSVIVRLNPGSLSTHLMRALLPRLSMPYDKIEFFPIFVDKRGYFERRSASD
jgi:hypothetical protein